MGSNPAYPTMRSRLAWRTETGVFDAVIPMLAGEFRISYLDIHDDV
ncbi:MAG: hypothetical protein MK184_05855 [Acidimicrobiales bacterium]|nr:hypothetical protein [Acidimicrobiales bacterium]